jgi:hypothetical protein
MDTVRREFQLPLPFSKGRFPLPGLVELLYRAGTRTKPVSPPDA